MKMKVLAWMMAVMMVLMCAGALAEGSITVQGVGYVNVDADHANIHMGVREVAPDVMAAQTAVNEKIEAVIAALNDIGIARDSISTDGIGIYANYDYSEGETITGYVAYNNLSVIVSDVNSVGAVIDAAFAAGLNSLDYVEFYTANTAEAGNKALTLAVASAREKAQVLADAAGMSLGKVTDIHDDANYYSYDSSISFARTEEDAGAGTQVLATRQRVTASVAMTFELVDAE